MKEYYVLFSEPMTMMGYTKFVRDISYNIWNKTSTDQSIRARILDSLSPHYGTLQTMHSMDIGRVFRVSEDEMDLMYLPLADKITAYYCITDIANLSKILKNRAQEFKDNL